MMTSLILLGILLFVGTFLYISGRTGADTKKEMQCIAFKSREAFDEIRPALSDENIFQSDMSWTPSVKAYNTLGMARNTPKEMWILKKDSERAMRIITAKFKAEVTPTAIIVS